MFDEVYFELKKSLEETIYQTDLRAFGKINEIQHWLARAERREQEILDSIQAAGE